MRKVVLITGAARRLGRDIAVSLAEDGCDIIVNYNNSKQADVTETIKCIEATGSNAIAIKADISNVTEIKKMFGKIRENFDSLDVLINNAAIFEEVDFFDIDEHIFDRFINTNLKSVLFCSIESAKMMHKSSAIPKKIVNIASLGAFMNWQSYIPYSVAKAGVVKLTQLMAKRLAPDILVNAIAPGTIIIGDDKNSSVNTGDKKKYPLKRFGKSTDITSLVRYLIKENTFITGQTIKIDGGRIL
ncbi:MAG: SDR family oxidoreductase [Ignavibacteriae bacterium]|nr:SDR family oxidoreductase [Ignavibacteriota bacterium]